MSMMLPPDPSAAPGLPTPPGGGGGLPPGLDGGPGLPPPMDSLNQGPIPADQGMGGLLAALAGGGGPGGPEGLPEGDNTLGGTSPEDDEEMGEVDHIQQAMKHLMMALGKSSDDERGSRLVKGMGPLQDILAGEQKNNKQLNALA